MTEDDTYYRLIRPSFNEMRSILDIWSTDFDDKRNIDELFEENHWTREEYDSGQGYI